MINTIFPKNTLRTDLKKVIHGHQPTTAIDLSANYICIDTGCGMGGKLSAVVLPDNIILSSKHPGKQINKRRAS